jgi:hypothetical protein
MMKTVIRRLDRMAFEAPLALLLGLAAAFAVVAMPASLFGALPGAPGVPLGKPMVAALAALLLGGIAFLGMKFAGNSSATALWEPDLAAVEEDEPEPEPKPVVVEEEPSIRTRRADRHPDAPTRQPIRASRDLGEPLMDFEPVPARRSVFVDEEPVVEVQSDPLHEEVLWQPVEDAEVEPRSPASWSPAPLSPANDEHALAEAPMAAEDIVGTGEPEAHDEIAAFAPADEPAPPPARAGRASITSLVDRLSTGVARRGGQAPSRFSADQIADAFGRPRAAAEDLRKALDELNRLAARHG